MQAHESEKNTFWLWTKSSDVEFEWENGRQIDRPSPVQGGIESTRTYKMVLLAHVKTTPMSILNEKLASKMKILVFHRLHSIEAWNGQIGPNASLAQGKQGSEGWRRLVFNGFLTPPGGGLLGGKKVDAG